MAHLPGARPRAPSPSEAPTIDLAQAPRVIARIVGGAVRDAPGRVAISIGAALGSAAASLTLPRLFGRAVDVAHHLAGHTPTGARHALAMTALMVIAATALRGFFAMAANYQSEWVSQKVANRWRLEFFAKLQSLSFGFHDRIHSGDLITRGMLDLEGARAFIQNGMMTFVTVALLVVIAAAMMIATDPVMAALGLAFTPLAGVVLARMGVMLRVTWLEVQRLMSVLTRIMEESLQGMRVVRAFAAAPFELAKYDEAAGAALAFSYRRIVLRFRAVLSMQASFYASLGAILWVGGHKVAAGTMSVGRLTEFLTYMTLLQSPIRQIAMIFASAARATSSGGRLFEILDLKPRIADAPGARPLAIGDGTLRFETVSFAYAGAARRALTEVSFEVGSGRTLGIVGPPGAGKSTIAHLIPRFYDPSEGRITIGGVDIREATLASLREHVGLVQQETFLFDATVENNVAYADPWAEEARIVEAAMTAQIHEHVASLPAAYETRVGERGVALSGGQRQRMSIARGIVPGPGIIIFDDATAAIDAVTEERVRRGLADATSGKATIIIAHRLSSLMHADEILVMEGGRIVERGTHAELIALEGEYADLFALQSRADQGFSIAEARMRRKLEEQEA